MDFLSRVVLGIVRRWRLHSIARAIPALVAIVAPAFCAQCSADENTGAVRLARFSYLSGSVTWHYGDDTSWSNATRNMPLRDGAQIWTSDSSRAEIQFDDGARLRLDSNSLITLQTLFSDDKGEFTELTLNNGSAHMHLKTRYSIYQINTPYASLKAAGPSRFSASVGAACEFKQFYGSSTIEGNGGSVTLQQGLDLRLSDANAPYQVAPLPGDDEWDTWNASRDERIDNPDRNQYIPSDIALECDDLNKHGSWHRDRQYGWVWAPTVSGPNWRPYGAGSWTWVHPFGWTWVSSDTWGWAPYHYGTWVHAEYGWAWVPGPANQYWSPGVVSFHQVNGGIAWVPLAPNEVQYPSALTVGFRSGNWSTFFSIGGAAVYYAYRKGRLLRSAAMVISLPQLLTVQSQRDKCEHQQHLSNRILVRSEKCAIWGWDFRRQPAVWGPGSLPAYTAKSSVDDRKWPSNRRSAWRRAPGHWPYWYSAEPFVIFTRSLVRRPTLHSAKCGDSCGVSRPTSKIGSADAGRAIRTASSCHE